MSLARQFLYISGAATKTTNLSKRIWEPAYCSLCWCSQSTRHQLSEQQRNRDSADGMAPFIGCSMSMSFCVPEPYPPHISRLDSARPMALVAHAKTGKRGHYSLETLPKCVCRGGIPEDSKKPPTRLMLTDNGHSLGSSNCSTFLTSLCEARCSATPDASLWHAVWPLEWFPLTFSPPVSVTALFPWLLRYH